MDDSSTTRSSVGGGGGGTGVASTRKLDSDVNDNVEEFDENPALNN